MNKGILRATAAYIAWGFFPIYWKWLHHVSSVQVICHRIIWSCVMLGAVIFLRRESSAFGVILRQPKIFLYYLIAALLIAVNWGTYVWGVNAGYVIETSLGYFINPILSVLLGVIFLREKLRTLQWVPVLIASSGVFYLTYVYGALPWIALVLAATFSLYGLVKKIAPLGTLHGLTLETLFLFIPAVTILILADVHGNGAFLRIDHKTDLMLIGTGLVTSIPLLLFASAVQQIPLTLVGILQFIAPTIQFFLGIWLYHEEFNHDHLIGFGLVWLALILFAIEGIHTHRTRNAKLPEPCEEII